ncbi:hypothetical protein DFP72DRAFT_898601 [Ephemerocybe angulata]|uniref:F-box domain-containing protein n=1 Tax=Ephemerocybe angulata TaxID=980116 RepID=A0A8H6HYK9_9AGAR|nr:hypothetical protein DFP72DRAFT_898601 [Tulosesus angulatus]
MANLLALPDEILSQILSALSAVEILQSQLICFKLNSVIKSSTEIQYLIALQIAGLEDNGRRSILSQAERLERLQRGQLAWRQWKPQFTQKIEVKQPASPIYDLSGGAYFLGRESMLDLDFAVLPDSKDDVKEWRSISVKETVLDVGLCMDEHDLVVVVTRKPVASQPSLLDIALHPMQYSTGQPHPLALHPRISVFKDQHPHPAVGLEIVGENLVLIVSHRPDEMAYGARPEDRVLVYEWRTGVLKMSLAAPYRSYSGLIFLDEHTLMLPNTKRGILEVWVLPRSPTEPSPSAPMCALELPLLAPGRSFAELSCRSEPNPIGERSPTPHTPKPTKRQHRPYRANTEDAIIVFNVRIQPVQTGPHPLLVVGFSHTYTFFVHRKSILRILHEQKRDEKPHIDIDFPSNSVLFPKPVPWEQWGPKATRWIETDDIPTRWITTTSGQRAVLISSAAANQQGSGSPIVIMDFNETRVKKIGHELAQKQRKEREKEERRRKLVASRLEREHAELVQKFRECKEWVERIENQLGDIKAASSSEPTLAPRGATLDLSLPLELDDWPPLNGADIELVKSFLEQHSDLGEQIENPTSPLQEVDQDTNTNGLLLDDLSDSLDSDQESNSGDDAEISLESPSGGADRQNAKARYARVWCLATSQVVDRAGVCFHSPVVSELACLGYTSKKQYHFDGVLIDDERILGVTTSSADDRIKRFEVFYFG